MFRHISPAGKNIHRHAKDEVLILLELAHTVFLRTAIRKANKAYLLVCPQLYEIQRNNI